MEPQRNFCVASLAGGDAKFRDFTSFYKTLLKPMRKKKEMGAFWYETE
jgi:hypothetical protein